jgi:hypothetical protein
MQPTVQQKEVVVITEKIPDYLVNHPCDAVSAREGGGEVGSLTVKSLSKAYVTNTLCIGQYKTLIEQQKSYLERGRVKQ